MKDRDTWAAHFRELSARRGRGTLNGHVPSVRIDWDRTKRGIGRRAEIGEEKSEGWPLAILKIAVGVIPAILLVKLVGKELEKYPHGVLRELRRPHHEDESREPRQGL